MVLINIDVTLYFEKNNRCISVVKNKVFNQISVRFFLKYYCLLAFMQNCRGIIFEIASTFIGKVKVCNLKFWAAGS